MHQRIVVQKFTVHNHGFTAVLHQGFNCPHFGFRAGGAGTHQNLNIVGATQGFNTMSQTGKEGVVQFGNHHADGGVALGNQCPGVGIGPVPHFVHNLLYALPGGVADFRAIVNDPGNGGQ